MASGTRLPPASGSAAKQRQRRPLDTVCLLPSPSALLVLLLLLLRLPSGTGRSSKLPLLIRQSGSTRRRRAEKAKEAARDGVLDVVIEVNRTGACCTVLLTPSTDCCDLNEVVSLEAERCQFAGREGRHSGQRVHSQSLLPIAVTSLMPLSIASSGSSISSLAAVTAVIPLQPLSSPLAHSSSLPSRSPAPSS
jgi:hypothetical protein